MRGRSNLLEDLDTAQDLERIRSLFDDLERNRDLIELLGDAENGDGVRIFNTSVRSFPMNLLAGAFKFTEAPGYPVPEAAKAAPKVDFSSLKPDAAGTTK